METQETHISGAWPNSLRVQGAEATQGREVPCLRPVLRATGLSRKSSVGSGIDLSSPHLAVGSQASPFTSVSQSPHL